MPRAIDRDLEKREQGLVTILVECQGLSAEAMPGFLYRTFPSFDAFASVNRGDPLPRSSGLPHAALIGVDGTLLWAGSPSAEGKKCDDLMDLELKKRKVGFGATPEVRKVRAALYGRGAFAEARKALDAVADAEQKQQLATEIDAVFARSLHSIEFLQNEGRWAAAKPIADKLVKGAAGAPELLEQATKAQAAFATPEAKKELAADAKVGKFLHALKELKADTLGKALTALTKATAGTKAGARVEKLAADLQASRK